MSARRCSTCNLNWPDYTAFDPCPRCSGPTSLMYSAEPMPSDEVKRLKLVIEFEQEYERLRGLPADSEFDLGEPLCDGDHEPGRICWLCDPVPRRDELWTVEDEELLA